jgi:dihydroorotase
VTIDAASLKSRSKNTPFHGWTLRGGVMMTMVGGRIVHESAALAAVNR